MSSRRLAFAALVVLVATAAADAVWGVGVRYVLAPADADDAAAGFVPGDDPARRHGAPVPGGPERVLLLDRSRLVVPPEAPEQPLLVLPAGADLDDLDAARPLAARRLWLVALGLAGVLLVAALLRRAREGARATGP